MITTLVTALVLSTGSVFLIRLLAHDGPGERRSVSELAGDAVGAVAEFATFVHVSARRDLTRVGSWFERQWSATLDPLDREATDEALEAPPVGSRDRVDTGPSLPVFRSVPRVGVDLPVTAVPTELPPLPGLYDARDLDVLPPGMDGIRTRRLSEAELAAAEVLVEVVIATTGEVEQARLLVAPRDVGESMVLSAIKTWRFSPATRDGRPVRYRHVLPVELAR